MKKVSPMLKDLISRILQPECSRLTIDQIYQHPWMNIDNGKPEYKLNFNKIANFSKYSKVFFYVNSVENFCSDMYFISNDRKRVIKIGITFQTN